MSLISVNIDGIKNLNINVGQNARRVSEIRDGMNSLRYSIDSKICARRNIDGRMYDAYAKASSLYSKLASLESFVNAYMNKYDTAESFLVRLAKGDVLDEKAVMQNCRIIEYDGNAQNNPKSWLLKMAEFLSDSKVNAISDLATSLPAGIIYKVKNIPRFRIDGRYLKVLNSKYYKGGQGLARWYTFNNIMSGKYPNATRLYNMSRIANGIETVGNVMMGISIAATLYKELFTDEKISLERKISNAALEVGRTVTAAEVGTMVGGAVGSILPGAGTLIGVAVGAIAAVGVSYLVDKALDWKVWGGGTKSTMDVVKDAVGDAVEAEVKTVGDCIKGLGSWLGGLSMPKPLVCGVYG